MSFLGKEYTFVKEENYVEFVNSLGLTPEKAQGFINYRPTQKLEQNGDSYTYTTTTPQTKKELTFKSGVTFDEKVGERDCKSTITVTGSTMSQEQVFNDGVTLKVVRQFSDNEMIATVTISKWDGVAKRYYKA